jgi:hypothetical protein
MHQACVFINQKQYNKSNELLTRIIKEAHHQGFISDSLKEAFKGLSSETEQQTTISIKLGQEIYSKQ